MHNSAHAVLHFPARHVRVCVQTRVLVLCHVFYRPLCALLDEKSACWGPGLRRHVLRNKRLFDFQYSVCVQG